ncbi:hypothetical protein AWC38_SpisGene22995 [Stylophora pistillata]|uniref:Uncharacterized protein n=1 Tax=Stylophora pistillata TaxID=50429 RepID=A0A2B4R9C8_STYPI|nr:hypothetical protein AWC38_SpisGene22995 [Stylophora pistillata]
MLVLTDFKCGRTLGLLAKYLSYLHPLLHLEPTVLEEVREVVQSADPHFRNTCVSGSDTDDTLATINSSSFVAITGSFVDAPDDSDEEEREVILSMLDENNSICPNSSSNTEIDGQIEDDDDDIEDDDEDVD